MSGANGKSPLERISIGPVSVAIWRNTVNRDDGAERSFLSATPGRNYRDARGDWQTSHAFTLSELPAAIEAMKLALAYIAGREAYGSVKVEEPVT